MVFLSIVFRRERGSANAVVPKNYKKNAVMNIQP
jgi:hypothetical protein